MNSGAEQTTERPVNSAVDPLTIVHGDCVEVMRSMDEASVDAIVTDPPYGIGFMGREWDSFSPERVKHRAQSLRRKGTTRRNEAYPEKAGTSQGGGTPIEYDLSPRGMAGYQDFTVRWAREAVRVLRPGGYILVCGGARTFHRQTCGLEDAGFEIRDCLIWLQGQGFPKSKAQLKPGWEPIVLGRKVGALAPLNIEVSRIVREPGDRTEYGVDGDEPSRTGKYGIYGDFKNRGPYVPSRGGRWPSNVALDDDAAAMLDEQSGNLPSGVAVRHRSGGNTFGSGTPKPPMANMGYADRGGASRFFYTAKADRAERGVGNTHPTVKPIALMRWLVRLVTPAGGLVLDPFAGSGTTGQAALAEGYRCVLIDKEAEYVAGIETWRAMQLGTGISA